MSKNRLHILGTLILLHLLLLPFFLRVAFTRLSILKIPVGANPCIPLGGLPLTPKDIRQGKSQAYASTNRLRNKKSFSSYPQVIKPLFGNRSRNITVLQRTDSLPVFDEPMIHQPYIEGEEFVINVAIVDEDVDIYGVTQIVSEKDIWEGKGEYINRTNQVDTDSLHNAVREACEEVGLRFGRLDVRSDSLQDLKQGNFTIIEVNGSLAVDLRLYTQATMRTKYNWLRNHWSKLVKVYDVGDSFTYPRFLWVYVFLFLAQPLSASSSWNKIKNKYFTSCPDS